MWKARHISLAQNVNQRLLQVAFRTLPHQVCIQFVHINDLIGDNRGNARDCAHPHGVCVRLYMCVCVRQGVFCVLFLLSTGLRQISDCFKWARQFHSVEMHVIAILWMS